MKPIKIAILADASNAISEMRTSGTAATNVGSQFDKAGSHAKSMADKFDHVGSKSSQLAGGIGDLGGAIEGLPGPLGAAGGALVAAQPAVMGLVGACDLLTLASNANILASARQVAATVASKAAMVAGAAATGVMTAAQWLLNVALSANPIGLIIIAIAALVAVFVIAYQHSDKFRAVLTAAWEGIKTASIAVFDFLKGYFTNVFYAYKAIFVTGIEAFKAVWNGITGLWTRAVEFKNRVVGVFTGLFDQMKNIGSNIVNGIATGIQSGFNWVKQKLVALGNLLPQWLKNKLGIASPSKVFMKLGEQTISGFAKGFQSLSTNDIVKPLATALSSTSLALGTPVASSLSTRTFNVDAASSAGVTHYNTFSINVAPTADKASIAREIVAALRDLERLDGTSLLVS